VSEAYDIVRGTYPTSLSEHERKGEADEYVRNKMKINPAYQDSGDGWKYKQIK